MPTQAQPNGSPGDKPEKTKLEREIEEILQRAERDSPLPPPTPIDSRRRKPADEPEKDFTFPDLGKTARHWLDTAPMLVAFVAAFLAMIVSDASALLATLFAVAAVVALFWPVAASLRAPDAAPKMWRGRPYDIQAEQPQAVSRVQDWLRKKGILKQRLNSPAPVGRSMRFMPRVVSDIVDVYVFRRLNARVQFLLLQRRPDVALPHTWQAFHSQIRVGDTTLEAVRQSVKDLCGLNVSTIYSADYVNQFYDEGRDAMVLAPVFAVNVSPQAPIDLGPDFRDAAWFDRDEATARLAFSGQRWAVRHIDEIMGLGEAESSIYRLDMSAPQPPHQDVEPDSDESLDNPALADLENEPHTEGDDSEAETEVAVVRTAADEHS